MTCSSQDIKRTTVTIGEDTDWNGHSFVRYRFETDIDLTGNTISVDFGAFNKTFSLEQDTTGFYFDVTLSKEDTSKFSEGNVCGVVKLTKDGKDTYLDQTIPLYAKQPGC